MRIKLKNGLFVFACATAILGFTGSVAQGSQLQGRRLIIKPVIARLQAEMLPDAPDFELKDLNGKLVHLHEYRGKAVLLNFWATWCVPCKEETPWLIAFQKQYGPEGLVILGVAMDGTVENVKKFTKTQQINYPVLFGNQRIADQYYVKGLPASIFIDRKGRITDQVPGAAARSILENEIKLALVNGAQSDAR
jgi:Peroxiredoxin